MLPVNVTLDPTQTEILPPPAETVGRLTVICNTPLAQVAVPAHAGTPTGVTTHAYEILDVVPAGE